MQVVAHQHISMHLNTLLHGMGLQQGQHALKVCHVHEDGLAIVTPQNDVVRVSGKGETG
jgi:hypothetical protein